MSQIPTQPSEGATKKDKEGIPEGLWMRCPECGDMLFRKVVEEALYVCPNCQHHFRISARTRIEQLADPGSFDAQYEGERELLPVVALQPLDGKREGLPELGEERQARAVMKPPVEAQHPEAGIVVQGGVLKGPAARDLHELHIDLNGLSGLCLLEELHLPGHALAGAAQARQPEVPEDPLNRAHGEPDPVGALEPEPGPRGPVAELLARASRISSIATGVTSRSRCRAYAGTSPSRPSRRQRRRHRRIVRALIP